MNNGRVGEKLKLIRAQEKRWEAGFRGKLSGSKMDLFVSMEK
jgi:hypothetical protein